MKMVHTAIIQLILFLFLLTGWLPSICQESLKESPHPEISDSTSVSLSDSVTQFLSDQKLGNISQNDSSLFLYWKSIDITDFSGSFDGKNSFLQYSINTRLCDTGSILYRYKKIDVSKSDNLNYRKLSEIYPKSFGEQHPWGELLLYSVFSTIYPNAGYAPVKNK